MTFDNYDNIFTEEILYDFLFHINVFFIYFIISSFFLNFILMYFSFFRVDSSPDSSVYSSSGESENSPPSPPFFWMASSKLFQNLMSPKNVGKILGVPTSSLCWSTHQHLSLSMHTKRQCDTTRFSVFKFCYTGP